MKAWHTRDNRKKLLNGKVIKIPWMVSVNFPLGFNYEFIYVRKCHKFVHSATIKKSFSVQKTFYFLCTERRKKSCWNWTSGCQSKVASCEGKGKPYDRIFTQELHHHVKRKLNHQFYLLSDIICNRRPIHLFRVKCNENKSFHATNAWRWQRSKKNKRN